MLLPILLATASALSYPPEGYVLNDSVDSPKHTFRLESYGKGADGDIAQRCVWIVTPDGTAAELLVAPGVLTPLYEAEFRISLNEQWIMWEQKLYHGADAYGLFERQSGIHYREMGPPIFSEQAWHFFSQQSGRDFKTDYIHIMRVSDWPVLDSHTRRIGLYGDPPDTPYRVPNDHSLLISLYGDDQHSHVYLWFCYYDLAQHRFYLDAALQKHNRGRVTASRNMCQVYNCRCSEPLAAPRSRFDSLAHSLTLRASRLCHGVLVRSIQ